MKYIKALIFIFEQYHSFYIELFKLNYYNMIYNFFNIFCL